MFRFTRRSREREEALEREKDERLDKAEAALRDLQERGTKAVLALDARQSRNHWREAIEQLIQGSS